MTARLGVVLALLGAGWIGLLPAAAAQEIFGLAGAMSADSPQGGNSYAWLISYQQELGEHLAASFTYQNEGHVPSHHRDGHSLQLWAKARAFSPRLSFAAGVGPPPYYHTTPARRRATTHTSHPPAY